MYKTAFFCSDTRNIDRVYGDLRNYLTDTTDLYPEIITSREMLLEKKDELKGLQAIFSTWGMLSLSDDEIKSFPDLKAVFYAAGSVRGFAKPFLENGVKVVSAWRANGLPVAEYTLAHILLAGSGYFRNSIAYKAKKSPAPIGPGSYREKLGIIGGGMIGRRVIELMQPFDMEILLCDPYLSAEQAAELGAKKAETNEIFRECLVVSNHLPLLDSTRGLIKKEHFEMMREGATFINTGRGATVDEAGMCEVLAARPDLTAVLDVTVKEPLPDDSPLYTLPNVEITTHIAGSKGNELRRMAQYCLSNFEQLKKGEPLCDEVTLDMLENMA